MGEAEAAAQYVALGLSAAAVEDAFLFCAEGAEVQGPPHRLLLLLLPSLPCFLAWQLLHICVCVCVCL